jgi:protein-S-isoprenylcysteine O-methyltransferase Ste14
MAAASRPPFGAVLGTLLFVALVPGTVIGLVPWWLARATPPAERFDGWLALVAGVALIAVALPVFVAFNLRFVREGHGTPAPVAPPQRLVVGGPFRWVRNPGYLGVMGLVVGEGLLYGSPRVLVWAALLWAAFHAFVLLYEEPALRGTFGREYDEYCRRVPRWIPRRPA